jgi:uncharacterized protein (UPF0332 family)
MKPEEKATYIKYRLDRAKETLQEAQTLFDTHFLSGAINRIYYAMFYAVSALALLKGFSTSSHTQLRGYFNREFVKTGIVSVDLGKLFQNRNKGDYKDLVTFNPEEVLDMLQKAEKFITIITALVARQTS